MTSSPLPHERPRRFSGRQITYLILILGTAVTMTWWSAQSQDQRAAVIRRGVGGLIASTCAGVTPVYSLEIEPIITHPTKSVLRRVCGAYNDDQTRVVVIASEGSETDPNVWTAKVLVDGKHAISLTIGDQDGVLKVIGAAVAPSGDSGAGESPS